MRLLGIVGVRVCLIGQSTLSWNSTGKLFKRANKLLLVCCSMPYAEAIIAESMRMSSIVPFGPFHTAMKDTKFHGYDIPKDTMVVSNLHFIHHDKRIWGNPEEFQPERFLSADGKTLKKHDALMPFGVGKRQCLGETLARDTTFLYFTTIFHRYSIRLADESLDVSLEPTQGFLLAPQKFQVVMQERL